MKKTGIHIILFTVIFLIPLLYPLDFQTNFITFQNICIQHFSQEEYIKNILHVFRWTAFHQLYKPLGFLFCIIVRIFRGNVFYYKIFFVFVYILTAFVIYTFLRITTKKPLLSLFATFFSLLTAPYLHQVFFGFYGNIGGVILIFLTGILFLKDEMRYSIFIFLSIILSFLNAFASDDSRLFVLPFLFILGIFYGFRKRRFYLIGLNFLFIFLSILLLPSIRGMINFPSSVSSVLWSIFFYTGFIADYYIYAIDISGVILFALSAIYSNMKVRSILLILLCFLSLFILFSFPALPYSVQWHNFFFVYPELPIQSFLFGILIVISSFIHIKYGMRFRKFFSAEIVVISFTILFVTGIFPRTRTDPSSRHLLIVYPFMVFLVMELIEEVVRKRDLITVFLIFPLIISQFFHLGVNIYNSSVREDAIYKEVQEVRRFLRINRRYISHNCLYVVGPNYFLPEIRDFVNPWGKGIVRVLPIPSGSLTDIKTFEFFLNLTKDECDKKFFLTMRFQPVVSPLYEGIEEFFQYLGKSQEPLSDQYMMAQYAYMHSPAPLPVENLLYKKNLVHRSSVKFYVLPLFLSELLHRITFHLPFALPYEVKAEIFEED